ncbi:HERV-H LTR-associating protein 2 isoform X3 [Meriones unguiculatus]|uniref:HERV-H LTR-associating protein 2 isoform X3 n=1 Tax=Meriones unguiculatus TaxID=10047 RepID=UPI00293EC447|nr:HERV-H LTR-associating protein 2 isoform X3 [Meriones unguiculatus]
MKAQALFYLFLVALFPYGSYVLDLFFPVFSSHLISDNEKLILGRYDEDVILPCLFKNGPQIVIHWKNKDKYVHTYYNDMDHLETQDLRYANRTSLFHSEIHNGNASLNVKRLSLLDEGTYSCYVSTMNSQATKNEVKLKVGAFQTPVMRYEKRNVGSFLECSILRLYPQSNVTWKMDNASVSESSSEKTGDPGPFYIKSTLNVTGSNSSFECAIKNSLLSQTWRGRWTLAGIHRMNQRESISLWCAVSSNFSLSDQGYRVTWSKVENGKYSVLATELSTKRNYYQHSWDKERTDNSAFFVTLKDLRASDSGEYLCNISSAEYALLTVHRLHVDSTKRTPWPIFAGVWFALPFVCFICYKLRRHCAGCKGNVNPGRCSSVEQAPEAGPEKTDTLLMKTDPSIQDHRPDEGVDCGSDDVIEHSSAFLIGFLGE